MGPDIIGWASSVILLVTLGAQTAKLYQTRTTRGVSKWLYIGELAAAAGFATYSALLHNRVYLATNVLGVVTSLLGLAFYVRNRRVERREAPAKRSLAPATLLPTPTQ